MKNLNTYIHEKLTIVHKKPYSYAPQTKEELRRIIRERLNQDPNADLNDIDVSNIIDMSFLFLGLDPHNIDISQWGVSKVEDMQGMFFTCTNFNSDLSTWDVSNAENMKLMFYGCNKFNSNINGWDVSKVKDISFMFGGCNSMKELPIWYKY